MVEKIFSSIGHAHDWIVKYLIQEDVQLVTEDGASTLESDFPVTLIVLQPFSDPMISPAYLFSKQKAEEYVKQFTALTPPHSNEVKNFAYTYFNRLADYPYRTDYGDWVGNGKGTGINQLKESIIDRLVINPTSRRAIAITLVPELDLKSHDPPCMQYVHCMIRNKRLNMIAYFRSNDMMSAWGANAYGLAHLQRLILTQINDAMNDSYAMSGNDEYATYQIGWLMTTSGSAHLYESDGMQHKEFRRYLNI